MTPDTLIKQLETYSNAIVAFVVLQGLAYAFAFGTNEFFNCTVKTAPHLVAILAGAFVFVGVLAVVAILWLGRTVGALAGEFREAVGKIYTGKVVVVLVFTILPLFLTLQYGVSDSPGKRECSKAASK